MEREAGAILNEITPAGAFMVPSNTRRSWSLEPREGGIYLCCSGQTGTAAKRRLGRSLGMFGRSVRNQHTLGQNETVETRGGLSSSSTDMFNSTMAG
jgi:hypothetical protein